MSLPIHLYKLTLIILKLSPTSEFQNTKQFTCMWPVFLELLHVRHNFEPNVSSHTNSHNFKVVSRFWISQYLKQFTCMWPVFLELLYVRHKFETNFLSHTNSHNFKFQIVQVHVEFLKKLLYVLRQNFGHMHLLLKPKYQKQGFLCSHLQEYHCSSTSGKYISPYTFY